MNLVLERMRPCVNQGISFPMTWSRKKYFLLSFKHLRPSDKGFAKNVVVKMNMFQSMQVPKECDSRQACKFCHCGCCSARSVGDSCNFDSRIIQFFYLLMFAAPTFFIFFALWVREFVNPKNIGASVLKIVLSFGSRLLSIHFPK